MGLITRALSPRYRTVVRSTWPPQQLLVYMADFRNAVQWDPSVQRSALVEGDGSSEGSAFDVTVRVGARVVQLRYVITSLSEATVVLTARSGRLTSVDTITVQPDPQGGSVMTYDARLSFSGAGRLANPLLARTLRTLGDNAAASLAERLSA